jgi:hypothetical protein
LQHIQQGGSNVDGPVNSLGQFGSAPSGGNSANSANASGGGGGAPGLANNAGNNAQLGNQGSGMQNGALMPFILLCSSPE